MANCHIDNLETELSSAKEQITDLEAELRNLHAEIVKAKFERDLLEDSLKDEKLNNNLHMETNEQLQKYVENRCGMSVNTTPNTKKSSDFANVSRRYQLKLLKEISASMLLYSALPFVFAVDCALTDNCCVTKKA